LDGDKIAAIFGLFIIGQLCILAGSKSSVSDATAAHKAVIPGNGEVKVAICTSTNYSKQVIRLEVASTPTGVKHLHKKAEQYDIGIYFEANGHGTILFNEIFSQWLQDASVQQKGLINFLYLSELCCDGCIPNGYSVVT
jgi:phosphoacetylglucosamine mutase